MIWKLQAQFFLSSMHTLLKSTGGCFIKITFRGRGQLSPSGKKFFLFMKQQMWEDGPFGEGVNSALRGRDFTLSWPLPRKDAETHPFGERVQLWESPFPQKFLRIPLPRRAELTPSPKGDFYETPSSRRRNTHRGLSTPAVQARSYILLVVWFAPNCAKSAKEKSETKEKL